MPTREHYDEIWRAVAPGLEPADFALRRRFLLGHVAAGQRVLDVGCGEGRFTAELLAAGAHVTGIDVAEEPLRRAREHLTREHLTREHRRTGERRTGQRQTGQRQTGQRQTGEHCTNLDLQLVPVDGPWELSDACFDLVWAGEVIEHVADTAAWLSEIRRVLRSGGELLLSTPANEPLTLARLALSRRAFASHFDPRGEHLRFYSRETLGTLIEDFGFEAITVQGAGGVPCARRLLLARAIRSRF